jgi:hypothetical protein
MVDALKIKLSLEIFDKISKDMRLHPERYNHLFTPTAINAANHLANINKKEKEKVSWIDDGF